MAGKGLGGSEMRPEMVREARYMTLGGWEALK